MYPLKFHPIPKSMIWGGDKLCQYKAIDTDQMNIGESWELSGVPGNESVVSNGEFAGRTVIELINEYGPDRLGRRVYETYGDKFPLLVKFIDARKF